MAKSLRYFSHYFQEIQTTKEKFKDYIIRNEAETEKLIELTDLKPVLNDLVSEEPLGEKAVLIKNIQEMSRTLDDITNKIADIKKDTIRLKQENEVIDEYVLNLMEQSKTFEPTKL